MPAPPSRCSRTGHFDDAAKAPQGQPSRLPGYYGSPGVNRPSPSVMPRRNLNRAKSSRSEAGPTYRRRDTRSARRGLSAAGQRLLGPDDLAGRRPPRTPALRHLADYLESPAALVLVAGIPQPRQRRRIVQPLAHQAAFQHQAQLDRALRIPDRVGDHLGDKQLGDGNELG